MKIHVAFTIFSSPTEVLSLSSGTIELDYLPEVGELVSFKFPLNETKAPNIPSFNGFLKVDKIHFMLNFQKKCRNSFNF